MKYEDMARQNHRSGYNCAQSVFVAFADLLGLSPAEAMRIAPKPRSEGGQCGAFLAGKAVLRQIKPNALPIYEKAFTDMNTYTECRSLVGMHRVLNKKCNDFVGDAARIVEEIIDAK